MPLRKVQHRNTRRGIALLEVMIAVGILTFSFATISSAIVAGQSQSLEARKTIIASVAAESLLSQISREPWETIDSWHDFREEVGTITDPTGILIGGDWDAVGRMVSIAETDMFIESLRVYIMGRTVTVTVFTKDEQSLISVERFIPEPQS
jgi:Tfp pilus assembly protein PilV